MTSSEKPAEFLCDGLNKPFLRIYRDGQAWMSVEVFSARVNPAFTA